MTHWPNQNKYFQDRRRKHRAYTDRVKTMFGCKVCGFNAHPAALHFNHVDPDKKKAPVSRLMEYAIKTIKTEIRKCEILCANCHAIHTYDEKHHLIKQG